MPSPDLLFRYYYRPLCLYALHYIKEVETAEDVVQDCFVRLMEHIEARHEPDHPRAYLYQAVRNACIDRLRRQQPLAGDISPEDLDGPITDAEAQERSLHEAELWTAIDALPPRCRQIFLMAKRDGMKYRDIALELGLSEKTVEHQVSKALKVLRRQRDDYFYIFMLL